MAAQAAADPPEALATLPSLATADLDAASKPLPIEYTKDPSDGVECWQVNLLTMEQVAAFCALHSFLGCKEVDEIELRVYMLTL